MKRFSLLICFGLLAGTTFAQTTPPMALEITPDKKVVWALRSWKAPANLGPATTIQLLDQPAPAEDLKLPEAR